MAGTQCGPGYYILRTSRNSYPHYIGRSDTDVEDRMSSHGGECPVCGVPTPDQKATRLDSSLDAFEMECLLFHGFQETICNKKHPDAPDGATAACPMCG